MMDATRLAEIGSVLGSEARAGILCALMGGTAHTGRELARHVAVAPSTASEHLGRLIDAGLVAVEAHGRHRYFRLAGPEVATAIEAVMSAMPVVGPAAPPRTTADLAFARSCYDHLAGELGVRIHDRLIELGAIEIEAEGAAVTPLGSELLTGIGVDHQPRGGRSLVRPCLDWTQRRHHLGGSVGARLLDTLLHHRWLARTGRPRVLRLTGAGRRHLAADLGIET